jgi:(p)ppGpp synthase/HD superfamily hydrolase
VYNLTHLTQDELLERLRRPPQVSAEGVARVLGAFEMAEDVHRFQKRADGTPYAWHVTRVAKIVIDELGMRDPDVICAALLHDALEDSEVLTPVILEHNFGPYVSYLVQTLTKDVRADESRRDEVNRAYVARFHDAVEDARIIKLADRLDNHRCLSFHIKRNPIRYINETRELYFPVMSGSTNQCVLYLMKEIQKEQNKYLG